MAQWIDKTFEVEDGTGNVATKWKIMSVMFNGDKGVLVFVLGGFLDDTRRKPIVLKQFPINLASGFITPTEIGDLESAVGAILMRLPFFEQAGASPMLGSSSQPGEGGDAPVSVYENGMGARIPNAFLKKEEPKEIEEVIEMKMIQSADRPSAPIKNDPANADPMDAEYTGDAMSFSMRPYVWVAGAGGVVAALVYGLKAVLS